MKSSIPDMHLALDAERKQVMVHGNRLSYYQDVSNDGTPLILIHSINAAPSAKEMQPLFDHYRCSRPVFAPDLPGFGASDRKPIEYSRDFFVQVINEFVSTVASQPVDIVALSLSCEFVTRAAIQQPGLYRTLTLISPTGLSSRALPSATKGEKVLKLLSLPGLGTGLYKLLTVKPSIRYFLNMAFVNNAPADLVDYAYHTSHQPGAHHAPFAFLSFKLFTVDAVDSLYSKLTQPALILYDQDANVSFERLDDLVDSRPNWHSERIKPSFGMPHFENLAAVVSAIDSHVLSQGE